MKSPVRAKNAMGMTVHQMCYLALFLAVVAVILGGLGTKAYYDVAHNADEDQEVGDLRINGTLLEYKNRVVDITSTSKTITKDESGTTFTLNVSGNSATTITLPAISGNDDIGLTYTFVVLTANTGAYAINTADGNDTTGDIFVGALGVGTTAADSGAITHLVAADNDATISLDSGETNGAGAVGSLVKVTAVKYSGSGHSHWLVDGYVGSADADTTGAEVFEDL